MKLGFVSAILDGWTFEEMIDTASEMGLFPCVEVACWPAGQGRTALCGRQSHRRGQPERRRLLTSSITVSER